MYRPCGVQRGSGKIGKGLCTGFTVITLAVATEALSDHVLAAAMRTEIPTVETLFFHDVTGIL